MLIVIGVALLSKFRGQGYMKEAVNAVLKELSRNNIVYVWACCFKENVVSEKLIRSVGLLVIFNLYFKET